MGIAFPDLDRSSAVGEESRPRSTSLSAASLTVVALAVTAGVLSGNPTSALSTATFTAVLVGGLALLDRDRFGVLFVGTLMTVIGGSIAVVSVLAVLARADGLVTFGFALGIVGVGMTWTNVGGNARGSVSSQVGGSYLGLVVGSVGVVIGVGAALTLLDAGTAGPVSSMATFLFLCSLLCVSLYAVLRAVPIVQLSPRPRREAVARRVALGRRATLAGGGVTFVSILATPYVAPAIPLSPVLGSIAVRLPLFLVVAVASVVAVVASLARRLAHSRSGRSRRQIAGVCAGAMLGAILLALPVPLYGVVALVAVLAVLPILLVIAVGFGSFIAGTRLTPAEGGSLALASGGLVIAAVGSGLADYPGPFVLACAAGAILVWDVSTFGAGLTAELGTIPDTRDLQLVHAVTTLGIGIGAVALGSGVLWLRSSVGPVGSTAAMVLGAVGALIALLPLRG